jgi:hypothetical protein
MTVDEILKYLISVIKYHQYYDWYYTEFDKVLCGIDIVMPDDWLILPILNFPFLLAYKIWCCIFHDIFNYDSRWNIEIFNWCDQVSSILWLILYWIWQSTMRYWHSDARRLFNITILTCHFLLV